MRLEPCFTLFQNCSTFQKIFENLQKIHAAHPFRSSFIAEQKEIPRKVGQLLSSRVDLLPHELPGDGDHDRKRHQMCYGQSTSEHRDSMENSWGYVVNMMVEPAIRNWMHPVLRGWSWIHWVCGYPLFEDSQPWITTKGIKHDATQTGK